MNSSAKQIFTGALEENRPAKLLDKNIEIEKKYIRLGEFKWKIDDRPTYIIAAGKASEEMCGYLSDQLKVDAANYICIAPHSANHENKQKKNYLYASHPYPDKKSVQAAEALIQFVRNIPPESLVLFALSGGASSLVCKPAEGIAVDAIAQVNKLLLESGAAIDEINSVRKHLSEVKGGQLLNYFHPDIILINLVISDVPDDDLEVIGSGLTIPDSSTFQEALHILLEYGLWKEIPQSVRKHIEKGLSGEDSETLKPGRNPLLNHHSFIMGSAQKFAESVARQAENSGFNPWIAKEYYNNSVEEVTNSIVNQIEQVRKRHEHSQALIYYGESTVDVTGSGKGGRNQQMALQAAIQIANMPNVTWLSAGTDGIDGPTDAAGAIVDGNTFTKANSIGLDASEYIRNNDSYRFHDKMNTLLKTGPTGNNLMDIVLILID